MSENPSTWGELAGLTLTKGHGTGNDFVFVTDENAEIALTPDLVARVCDRHFGIGADGFIRAIRSSASRIGQKLLEDYPKAEWFMDYRNGDGSIAEMCGNGVRAFVEYLRTEGLVALEVGQAVQIGTRAGVKTVVRTENGYAVDMGPWSFIHGAAAREGGEDSLVSARGLKTPRAGLSISMGNPHTVVMLGSEGKLDGLDLHSQPQVNPIPVEGTNVEFVVPVDLETDGLQHVGAIWMRVYERGVGEPLSCGTGACAAAAATRFWGGEEAPDEWLVHVPGGTVAVTFVLGPDDLEHVVLAGPAQMVAAVILY